MELVEHELRPFVAHFELVFVDLHDLVRVEHVVEWHEHDIVLVRQPDHAVKAVGCHRDRNNGVVPLVDEVLDGSELHGSVRPGRHHLEIGDLVLHRRILGEGLGGLDHLDAPAIADEAVDHGELVRAVLGFPLHIFGVSAPRREAFGFRARTGDHFGAGEGHACRQHETGGGCCQKHFEFHVLPPMTAIAVVSISASPQAAPPS